MLDLHAITPSCAVLLGQDTAGRFEHLGSAWCVDHHAWVTSWNVAVPPENAVVMSVQDGTIATISAWEFDAGLAGFTAALEAPPLTTRRTGDLTKRDRLWALGFPDVINHPALRLARGSLDPARYFPYVCPWTVQGHLALFAASQGWLTGRCYPGMEGGPVLDEAGAVVGVLASSPASPDHPPLARFHRLA